MKNPINAVVIIAALAAYTELGVIEAIVMLQRNGLSFDEATKVLTIFDDAVAVIRNSDVKKKG